MTSPPSPRACPDPACSDFTGVAASRRRFLGGLALGGATAVFGSAAITMTGAPAAAAGTGIDSVLVVLSLRGAADGMSLVVPHGDPAYYRARPTIAVPTTELLAADPMFGLHPALAPLLPMWQAGELAAVHATGMAVPNRSHFSAIEEIEEAQVGSATRSGWLNRMVGDLGDSNPVAALNVDGSVPPISMLGVNETLAVSSLSGIRVEGGAGPTSFRRRSLSNMWAEEQTHIGNAARGAMKVVDAFAANSDAATPSKYPVSDLGRAMSEVAFSVRAGVGARLVTVDAGQWDMHANLGTPGSGPMRDNASDLAASIASFFADLGNERSRVTLVTMSEFGRRTQENGGRGLDHGWGNVMFVAGAGVSGGRYHGRWPGLANTADNDLTVTTDYRSVLGEIVAARFPAVSVPKVFPGFTRERVGVMSGR